MRSGSSGAFSLASWLFTFGTYGNGGDRECKTKAWNAGGFNHMKDGERMLLWHGSRTTNFAGILKQGLRIAPPEGSHTSPCASSRSTLMLTAPCSAGDWVHVRQGRVLCGRQWFFVLIRWGLLLTF